MPLYLTRATPGAAPKNYGAGLREQKNTPWPKPGRVNPASVGVHSDRPSID